MHRNHGSRGHHFLEHRSGEDSSKTVHTGDVEDNALGAPKVVIW